MALSNLLQQLATAPGFIGGMQQGQQLRQQQEQQNLIREQIAQQMAIQQAQESRAAEQYAFESSPAMRDLILQQQAQKAFPQPEYEIKTDENGEFVYVPKKPGRGEVTPTGIAGQKLPEVEAERVKFASEDYKYYVEKARTNSRTFQAATRALPALRESIKLGEKATGPAAKYTSMAANALQQAGIDPKEAINLLNIDPKKYAIIQSALNEMAIGELQAFSGPTTDFEYEKAAEVVGTTASAQEVILALMQTKMEPLVNWQKKFQETTQKYDNDYEKISNEMLQYEINEPLSAWSTEATVPIESPGEYISPEALWEKSKSAMRTLGSGAKEMYGELYNALSADPANLQGYLEVKVTSEGKTKTLIIQDGVVVGVK